MKLFKRLLLVLLILLGAIAVYNYPKLNIIAGYASKNMASTHFIAGRDYKAIADNDNNVPLIKLADTKVEGNNVSATVFGLMERKALCRDGLGCVLINDDYHDDTAWPKPNREQSENGLPFPFGNNGQQDSIFENVDYSKLTAALDFAFDHYETQKTRTVLVAYKNRIIAERYGQGFTAQTPILGWSMTKSILATLYGILSYQNLVDINQAAPVKAWKQDDRKAITLNHLLRMQSGLAWEEDYTTISDVTKMLFLESDMSEPQAMKKAVAPPTGIWNYSSGTSNLLSGILRQQFATFQEYLDFPYKALIDKIGMHSMMIETDLAENFVGSSYGWANTRDWAKFGLLYLNKGQWNNEQLFDPAWVDYITKVTQGSDGTYGAHFWLNAQGKYPDVPRDLYSANGYQGQYVFIIPSKDLVVVRTGLAEDPDFDVNGFLKMVVGAIN